MDMFGAFDQFAESGQLVAALGVAGIIHFQQRGAVGLDDQRVLRIIDHTDKPPEHKASATSSEPVQNNQKQRRLVAAKVNSKVYPILEKWHNSGFTT